MPSTTWIAHEPKALLRIDGANRRTGKKYDKQVICTTNNPAILDGLNVNDDEQRLYIIQRDNDGHTVRIRAKPPKPQPGKIPMKLSAAFLGGHLGGLPDHF